MAENPANPTNPENPANPANPENPGNPGNPGGQGNQPVNNPAQPEKTFTQADVDAIVARRLAKAQKGMPDEAELAAYRAWKESQQTDQQRMEALTKERDDAKKDLLTANEKTEQYEREILLLKKGVDPEDVDYYIFKAGKMVSDTKTFEQAVDELIKARKKDDGNRRVDFGAPLGGGQNPQPSRAAQLYQQHYEALYGVQKGSSK